MSGRSRPASDVAVQWRVLLGISAFIAVIAVVYWFASYEQAGTTLLALASGLTLLSGGYLFVQDRRGPTVPDPAGAAPASPVPALADDPADEHYLPHASIWPLVIGAGAVAGFNGMILGLAYCFPGVVLVAVGLAGMASQSRRRA